MSSGFVTEKEIEEKKKLRQEEWDRVRKPEDPLDVPLAPEELPDRRSLFERLNEQKMKKQEEFEEAHKLKNLVKTLDDDEADFLDHVDKTRWEADRKKRLEEEIELSEFRSKVAELRENAVDTLIKTEIGLIKTENKKSVFADQGLPSIGTTKTSQSQRLAGLVKRKSTTSESISSTEVVPEKMPRHEGPEKVIPGAVTKPDDKNAVIDSVPYKGNLVCIGVLPGLDSYNNSSSDESGEDSTSDSENPSPIRDLCGRKIVTQPEDDKSCSKEKK